MRNKIYNKNAREKALLEEAYSNVYNESDFAAGLENPSYGSDNYILQAIRDGQIKVVEVGGLDPSEHEQSDAYIVKAFIQTRDGERELTDEEYEYINNPTWDPKKREVYNDLTDFVHAAAEREGIDYRAGMEDFGENEETEEEKKEARDRKKPGGSNVGDYSNVSKDDFCGPAGGAPEGSYPVNSEKRARAALSYARNAPNPQGIRDCVYRKAKKHKWFEDEENPDAHTYSRGGMEPGPAAELDPAIGFDEAYTELYTRAKGKTIIEEGPLDYLRTPKEVTQRKKDVQSQSKPGKVIPKKKILNGPAQRPVPPVVGPEDFDPPTTKPGTKKGFHSKTDKRLVKKIVKGAEPGSHPIAGTDPKQQRKIRKWEAKRDAKPAPKAPSTPKYPIPKPPKGGWPKPVPYSDEEIDGERWRDEYEQVAIDPDNAQGFTPEDIEISIMDDGEWEYDRIGVGKVGDDVFVADVENFGDPNTIWKVNFDSVEDVLNSGLESGWLIKTGNPYDKDDIVRTPDDVKFDIFDEWLSANKVSDDKEPDKSWDEGGTQEYDMERDPLGRREADPREW